MPYHSKDNKMSSSYGKPKKATAKPSSKKKKSSSKMSYNGMKGKK